MSDKNSDQNDISTWAYPDWDDNGQTIKVEDVTPEELIVEVKPLTVAEVEDIRQQAWQEGFDQGNKKGFDEGHQKGHEQGYQAGFEQGEPEGVAAGTVTGQQQAYNEHKEFVEQTVNQLISIVEMYQQPLMAQQKDIEQSLVMMSTRLAKSIIQQELSISEDIICRAVESMVVALPHGYEKTRLWLNPKDIETIEAFLEKRHLSDWKIFPDDSLVLGACRLETAHSCIDFSMQKKFIEHCKSIIEKAELEEFSESITDLSKEDPLSELLQPAPAAQEAPEDAAQQQMSAELEAESTAEIPEIVEAKIPEEIEPTITPKNDEPEL
jgi:flagellar assembly protein FliH